MQDGLDYEARARYKPRHPSLARTEQTDESAAAPLIPEPPISEEDTRPKISAVPESAPLDEPNFLTDMSRFEPPRESIVSERARDSARHEIETTEETSIPEQSILAEQTDLSLLDTAQISVFDVFGLPKPSETQEMKAISVQETPAAITTQSTSLRAEATTVELPYESAGRVGRRVIARRNLINVRRP